MCGAWAFAHCPETLMVRLSMPTMDAKGLIVCQVRRSTSASNIKRYLVLLNKTWGVHDKSSAYDDPGWKQAQYLWYCCSITKEWKKPQPHIYAYVSIGIYNGTIIFCPISCHILIGWFDAQCGSSLILRIWFKIYRSAITLTQTVFGYQSGNVDVGGSVHSQRLLIKDQTFQLLSLTVVTYCWLSRKVPKLHSIHGPLRGLHGRVQCLISFVS